MPEPMRATEPLTDAERDVLRVVPLDGRRLPFAELHALLGRRYQTAEMMKAVRTLADARDLLRVEVDSRYRLVAVWRAPRA